MCRHWLTQTVTTEDMTAVMDGLMQSYAAAGAGDEAMHISKMSLTMTCANFNSATEFTISDEAKQ